MISVMLHSVVLSLDTRKDELLRSQYALHYELSPLCGLKSGHVAKRIRNTFEVLKRDVEEGWRRWLDQSY